MFNARWDRIAVTGFVEFCFSIDGKFDLAFDYSAPLSTMRVRGKALVRDFSRQFYGINRPILTDKPDAGLQRCRGLEPKGLGVARGTYTHRIAL